MAPTPESGVKHEATCHAHLGAKLPLPGRGLTCGLAVERLIGPNGSGKTNVLNVLRSRADPVGRGEQIDCERQPVVVADESVSRRLTRLVPTRMQRLREARSAMTAAWTAAHRSMMSAWWSTRHGRATDVSSSLWSAAADAGGGHRSLCVGRAVYDTPRYDTPRAALMELTDYVQFESVAIQVLRVRHPELRITAPTGDRGRDAYGRSLFGERDEIVGLFSCERDWRRKLNRDLQPYGQDPTEEKPKKALFVTNQPIIEVNKEQTKQEVYDSYQIQLEIVALDELDLELKSDALHRVAERELGVRPRQPRVLQPSAAFWDAQPSSFGRDAPLVGRDDELGRLRTALAPAADSPRNRVVVVEGPGGIGKTRLAVEAGPTSTTLIARTGTALSEDKLVDVQVDVPSVIVIDDAHRSSDLSGLATIVGDPHFAGVTVVLTVRPGLADPTLRRVGLDNLQHTTITLGPLGRSEISEIVTAHGITDEAFHLHVIDIAEGNPLIAHTACEIATQQGTYSWQDTASVLRDLFKRRQSHLTSDGHERLAVAVTLAVLTTAQNSDQIAALAGAVHGLPRDQHRLDKILMDLADAGIVDGPPFTLHPDALGPVIVADALADGRRVNVDLTRMLRVLGRAASWGAGAGEDSDEPGLLAIGPPRPGADGVLAGVHATVLASQLGVLAQAAHLGEPARV